MHTPRFSVIIPVHNAERTIAAALQSLRAQTFTDFEIILIDDGSTDDSIRAMLPFAGNDERVRMFAKSQEGVSATRNYGVELARGELLAFLDADDCWDSKKLFEHFCLHMRNPEIEASLCQDRLSIGASRRHAGRTDDLFDRSARPARPRHRPVGKPRMHHVQLRHPAHLVP